MSSSSKSSRAGGSVGGSTLGGGSTRTKGSDRGGPADRNNLRRNITERAFLDDNNTLLPESFKQAHKPKPTKALTDALEFRRKYNEERRAKMEVGAYRVICCSRFLFYVCYMPVLLSIFLRISSAYPSICKINNDLPSLYSYISIQSI